VKRFESIGQWHDVWAWLLVQAPDRFRPRRGEVVDQPAALRDAFEELRSGFHFAKHKVKDERLVRILHEMVAMSQEAYSSGNRRVGAHILQECEGLIWKKQSLRIKHAVEAELRAFGALELFKDVRVSIYPYEGTAADLGEDQKGLLEVAIVHAHRYLEARQKFEFFAWAVETNGRTIRISRDPVGDEHAAPAPLQKSWRSSVNRIRKLVAEDRIRASAVVELVCPSWAPGGSLSFKLDQRGFPTAKPICGISFSGAGFAATNLRYHLYDPDIFSNEATKQSSQPGGPSISTIAGDY
jgi:hypothetical protein